MSCPAGFRPDRPQSRHLVGRHTLVHAHPTDGRAQCDVVDDDDAFGSQRQSDEVDGGGAEIVNRPVNR